MTSISRHSEGGFSLVEVMVALTVITAGIIGTISMVSANRAVMEASWTQARMGLIADGVMNELAVQFQRNGILPVTADYDFEEDPDNLGLAVLFADNGYIPAASTLNITAGVTPISYRAILTLISPSGRRMVRSRNFFQKFKTP